MEHIRAMLPAHWRERVPDYQPNDFRKAIPELNNWGVSDETIRQHQTLLVEYIRQTKICRGCRGFSECGKEGDLQGFTQVLEPYGNQLTTRVGRCRPFLDEQMHKRVEKWSKFAGSMLEDDEFRFDNFPTEQRKKYPRLMGFAEEFASTHQADTGGPGLYIFGPPGVGKTHLMLAVVNRLRERNIPCLFVRSDSIFDRMRQIISENGDLEAFLDACATVPVLAIDEFAQERANDFTLEKLFRIINSRFHAKLPTWFTSNYAPPDIYRRNGTDITDSVGPLRSRIMQMAKLAKMDGNDARQRFLESLT